MSHDELLELVDSYAKELLPEDCWPKALTHRVLHFSPVVYFEVPSGEEAIIDRREAIDVPTVKAIIRSRLLVALKSVSDRALELARILESGENNEDNDNTDR